MDEDLGRLLSNPFQTAGAAAKAAAPPDDTPLDFADLTGRSIRDHSAFRKPAPIVLRPHVASAEYLLKRLTGATLPINAKTVIDQHLPRIRQHVESLKKRFRVFVDTAAEDVLEKEASRLERRYFSGTATHGQLQFLKLKRYYEKIRTFQEFAKTDWRELHKIIDTLSLMPDTRTMAREVEVEYLKGVHLLLRQTDSFLDSLKIFMHVEHEETDSVTGGTKLNLTYNPHIHYSIPAFLGDAVENEHALDEAVQSPSELEEATPRDDGGSIARSIVLETKERRLNRASILSAPLLGSRDWNRTMDYALEIPVKFYEECMENFRKSYHVNVGEEILTQPMSSAAALVRKGAGEAQIPEYEQYILRSLEDIIEAVLKTDFPGTDKPFVFVYHCGPQVIYNILVQVLRQTKMGEIFYLDRNNVTVRELPEELIKKIVIDWWETRFAPLHREDVDSYLTYSRTIEMVKRDYRVLNEEGAKQAKKALPMAPYAQREKWLRENQARVFGIRKLEIFRRFLGAATFS